MKRLTRNEVEGKIAGVAAGIADYLNIDAVIIRLGFVLTAFAHGLGLIAYVICWIVVPSGTAAKSTVGGGGATTDPEAEGVGATAQKVVDEVHHAADEIRKAAGDASQAARSAAADLRTSAASVDTGKERAAFGIVLIVVGAALLFARFNWFVIPWHTLRDLWPLLVIACGLGLLLTAARRKKS